MADHETMSWLIEELQNSVREFHEEEDAWMLEPDFLIKRLVI
jgi:hypothetical protein